MDIIKRREWRFQNADDPARLSPADSTKCAVHSSLQDLVCHTALPRLRIVMVYSGLFALVLMSDAIRLQGESSSTMAMNRSALAFALLVSCIAAGAHARRQILQEVDRLVSVPISFQHDKDIYFGFTCTRWNISKGIACPCCKLHHCCNCH